MFGGKASVPMVVRLPGGSGTGAAGAAQPEPRSVVRARAGAQGRAAVDAARRQGPAARGDRRSQSGADLRAQAALQDQGPGALRAVPRADRRGGRAPRRARRHDRRRVDHGDPRVGGGGAPCGRKASTPKSSTCARCVRSTSRRSRQSVRKTASAAHRVRRRQDDGHRRGDLPRWSPRARCSTSSTRRSRGWAAPTRRSPTTRCSRRPRCRRKTTSSPPRGGSSGTGRR